MSHALPEWRVASDTSIGSERAMTSEALMSPSELANILLEAFNTCLLYTSPSPRDGLLSRMPSSA